MTNLSRRLDKLEELRDAQRAAIVGPDVSLTPRERVEALVPMLEHAGIDPLLAVLRGARETGDYAGALAQVREVLYGQSEK